MTEWISVKDRLPELIEGTDYSANVFGMCKLGPEPRMGIYSYIIIDEHSSFAWAKLNYVGWEDIRSAECEFDDDYEVTHWMPLPDAPEEAT